MGPKKQNVVKMEDLIGGKGDNLAKSIKNVENQGPKTARKVNQKEVVIRGKPKSGRIWKNTKEKFSSIVKTKGVKKPHKKKEALRKELQRVKDLSKAIKAQKEEEKELHKQRRRENLWRQEENRKKSEIVQVITNTTKLKRMKKKQLRTIEKRDTLNM